MKGFDFIVIGSGIAGMSFASLISDERSVCILEKEKELSYHSSGRSFAFFIESYGNQTIRNLTQISKTFFKDHSNSFLKKKGVMYIGNDKQKDIINNFYKDYKNQVELLRLNKKETLDKANFLKDSYIDSSVVDIHASEIDVNELYEYYRKIYKRNNGNFYKDYSIQKAENINDHWILNGELRCKYIINAAGAWVDEVASLFGVKKINVTPKKRTVFICQPENFLANSNLPAVCDIEEKFYFKDQMQKIYASPADETPTTPHDCYADEFDIAVGIDRLQHATNFNFRSVEHSWAGLRPFVEDKSPVLGFDNYVKNFFWVAALGGYGIMISPAMALLGKQLVLNEIDEDFLEQYKINLKDIDASRIR